MIPLVDLQRQYLSIKPDIDQAIQYVLTKGVFINGEQIRAFEKKFAQMSQAHYAIGTSSGTSALHLALLALGIGDGDEVITVPNTFIATTEAISQTGARIRFVDIEERSYNMDPQNIEGAITDKTKAIIPVNLYGQPCDLKAITSIAQKYGLKIVIDAAQSHLAEYNGQPMGTFGDCVCYSFYPGKNLGAYGDGGLVTTSDEQLSIKIRMLANHGRIRKYEHLIEGYNCRLDELQAAVLNVKLEHLPAWTEKRRKVAKQYNLMLEGSNVITPWVSENVKHVYHLYVIRLQHRDKVKDALAGKDIAAGIHYPIALHLQQAYRYLGYKEGDFPVAEKCCSEILSLPVFPELEHDEVKHIVYNLKQAIGQQTKRLVQNV